MKAYFRLLFAFLALGLVAAAVVGVLYVWENLIAPRRAIEAEIADIRKRTKVKVDYGDKVYQEALSLLSADELSRAVDKLHELMRTYRDSARYGEAKRIVGEVNIDRLLSKAPAPGKGDYIVQPGDVLTRIAQKAKSTVGYIMHVNGRMGSGLQRGDQLIVSPLEFSILINLSDKTLTLRSAEDKFFKEYQLASYKLPPSTPSSFDSEIKSLVVSTGARLIPVGTPQYIAAPKELRCRRRGVPLRALSGDEEKDRYATGFILPREDIEELALIIRPGTKVHVRK